MNDLKFLLVDDDLDVLEILILTIENKFPTSQIHSYTSPLKAIAAVEEGLHPDLVIVDLSMPEQNGLMFTQSLLKSSPNLKVILYSGIIDDVELIHNIHIGFMGILEKPSSEEVIYQEVLKVLNTERNVQDEYINYELSLANAHLIWDFDLYVIINKSRYIKLFNKGDKIDHDKIKQMIQYEKVQYAIKMADFLSIPASIYTPIFISQIPLNKALFCDLFLKKEGGFKKILSKGVNFTKATADVLRSKKIKSVYVDKDCQAAIMHHTEAILSGKIKDIEFEREEKINLILSLANQKLQAIMDEPSEESMSDIWHFSNVIVRYIEDDKTAILDMINLHDEDNLKTHALNVATISINILLFFEVIKNRHHEDKKIENLSKELSYSAEIKRCLTIASLVHDLGYTLLKKQDPTYQSKGLPQDHSVEISEVCAFLSQITFVPDKIIQLVRQHEERFDGSGPKGLFKAEIDIYAQIIIIANQYDRILSNNKTKQEALLELMNEKNKYNLTIVQALKEVIIDQK